MSLCREGSDISAAEAGGDAAAAKTKKLRNP
jgi:hypothetical protein